jgi:hypothetical protein
MKSVRGQDGNIKDGTKMESKDGSDVNVNTAAGDDA